MKHYSHYLKNVQTSRDQISNKICYFILIKFGKPNVGDQEQFYVCRKSQFFRKLKTDTKVFTANIFFTRFKCISHVGFFGLVWYCFITIVKLFDKC